MDEMTEGSDLHALWSSSMLAGGNADYLEQMYERYLLDPNSVSHSLRTYFQMMAGGAGREESHAAIREQFRKRALHGSIRYAPGTPAVTSDHDFRKKQSAVHQMIEGFRIHGHREAGIDPLDMSEKVQMHELDYYHHGFSEADFNDVYDVDGFSSGGTMHLGELIQALRNTYCGHIGHEFMHITDMTERRWIQHRVEGNRGHLSYPDNIRKRLLERISVAEGLEKYLHTRYVGQKRFSLEGAETLIPILDEIIRRSGSHDVKEVVIGMAHRGRLNVLVNIMGKKPAELFQEFEGKAATNGNSNGTGDVKYHMGFSSNIQTPDGEVHVALAFNPSHLEIVNPVVEGSVRARQDRRLDKNGNQVVPVLIHGDAAFAGQGVVMETLNMSQSRGYSTKGTVHIVINNQIGFTTSNQKDARSTLYCTDVAKMVNAPIFHVNGDDPEAVLFVAQIALDYRMTFHKDVVIDLVCYRRHGHSEADEPTVTQPLMYRKIKSMPTTREQYAGKLVELGVVAQDEADLLVSNYRQALDEGICVVSELIPDEQAHYDYEEDWSRYLGTDTTASVDTHLTISSIQELYAEVDTLPDKFVLHPNVQKILENRRKMAAGAMAIDWGFAEIIAYASLVKEGFGIRLSGQDSGRGTFFHRHAVLYDQQDDKVFVPLRELGDEKANFLVINSLLSEEAVLAFEYGYATTMPTTLVIWEAQFGDFANNAQVVIDQFISAGEQKWNRLCGLVMMLPHGFEGQGPEHSSARLERYLQLCAQHNMQICVPTTPAQVFHALRRQMHLACRKPLVIMTPKSLLRHRMSVSTLEDLSGGGFQSVIPDAGISSADRVRRVVMCSGKIYYDLQERRQKEERDDVALVRIEQLYPFPEKHLEKVLSGYPNVREFIWCQEEPMNQGAWFSSQHHIRNIISSADLKYAGRPFSAAPAVGYAALHLKQLRSLIDEVFS